MPKSYSAQEVEAELKEKWDKNNLYKTLRSKKGKPFYFLDGPPYTSGKVHIGTAWNKSMKDMVVRYKRMTGHQVFDRAGYDMHGLPIEHRIMKQLGITSKEEVVAHGVEEFMKACKEFAVESLATMNEDFKDIGVSLDLEDAYQTISEEWIQSVWWLIKKAYDEGNLYEGLRPMAWDPEHETACAKHELEYKTVEDDSIYVKFTTQDNEQLIIWTTTPWTIPFNLMVMVNPDLVYAKVKVEEEIWIIAEDLIEPVLEAAEKSGEIKETFPGSELINTKYTHFLEDIMPFDELKGKLHTVVGSKEYVTTEAGTGLVHAAPGCGPEDYEVGVAHNVPAFNLLTSTGHFPKELKEIGGWRARYEDEKFVDLIDTRKHLVAAKKYLHEYPHAERSKAPVVYKATKQWFFDASKYKEQMIEQNNDVHWMPKAGYNAFNSWLENLRDNSITKQRYWGTPFPIWKNVDDDQDIIVIGSKQELIELAGVEPEDLHIPWIDKIVIEKDGKTYKRMPDVIDVWVDAGVASFASLRYPHQTQDFDKYFPADFIIEGNDQVRGWFNLLMVASTLAFGKAPFKNVYMHGMIQDAQGRKMSKSVGNYIRPEEVISKYGADAVRLYFINGTKAGNDLSYNHDDCETKHKNLHVYWNIHSYLLELAEQSEHVKQLKDVELELEDKYIIAKTHKAIKEVHDFMGRYQLEKVPEVVEHLLMEISRTYIQFVRTRAQEKPEEVVPVLEYAYKSAIQLMAPITPFITDKIWNNLSESFGYEHESVHASQLPTTGIEHEEETILKVERAQQIISQILSARDKSQIGTRWPLKSVQISGEPVNDEDALELIKEQTNVKEIVFTENLELKYTVKPDYRALGKQYGQETGEIAQHIMSNAEEMARQYADNQEVEVKEHTLNESFLEIELEAMEGYQISTDGNYTVKLDTKQSQELLNEGYQRELIRRVQLLRREAGLDRADKIHLLLDENHKEFATDTELIAMITGAERVDFADPTKCPHQEETTVKGKEMRFGFNLMGQSK